MPVEATRAGKEKQAAPSPAFLMLGGKAVDGGCRQVGKQGRKDIHGRSWTISLEVFKKGEF